MKVEDNRDNAYFTELRPGEAFEYNGEVYIKAINDGEFDKYAVKVSNGEVCKILTQLYVKVRRIDARVVIE